MLSGVPGVTSGSVARPSAFPRHASEGTPVMASIDELEKR